MTSTLRFYGATSKFRWWLVGEDDPRQLDSNFKCFSIGIRRYFLTRFSFTCPVEDCAVQDP